MQKNYKEKVLRVILSKITKDELARRLDNYHSGDVADALQQTTKERRLYVYESIGLLKTAEIFSFYENADEYLKELPQEYAADLLEKMPSDEAADLLNELEESDKDKLILLMEQEARTHICRIDSYKKETIGGYMTNNYIVLQTPQTVKTAMSEMIRQAGEKENIFTLYVINEKKQYIGVVSLKDLITARKEDDFSQLIMTSYPFFYDDEQMSDCIEKLKDYRENSLPVLNHKQELLGVVTLDDAMEAAEEEFEEDYAKFGGLTEEEDIEEPVKLSVKKRIPWLIALLFLGLIVSCVVGVFEGVIATIPAVVFFQSMILDMAGNVGTQSLAVTIRNLSEFSTDEEKKRHKKVVFKELKIGIVNGVLLGVISCFVVVVYLAIIKQEIISGNGYVFSDTLLIGGIIGVSMLLSITLSSAVGTLFPIFLTKIRIDPAVASGPFITTINDIVAIGVYYGLTFLLFMAVL